MKKRWGRHLLGLAILFFFSGLMGTGSPGIAQTALSAKAKPELAKLSIGLPVVAITFLPAWVAEQKGFFKEEGITEVKVLGFRGDADVVQALAGGTVDVNIASLIGLVGTISSGQKFRSIWAGYNMPFFDWYAQPKYKTIAETKGGRYAISKYGSLTDSLTRYALRQSGLDPDKDVKILQLGTQNQSLAAMEAGQIDAAVLPSPLYIAAEKGFVKLMSQKEHVAPDWPTHVVYSKEDFIAKNPNTMKAFLRATGRAMVWIKAHHDEAAQMANKWLKYKVEHCRMAIDEVEEGWYPDGRLPGKGLKVFWEIAVQGGDVKEPWPNNRWLDDTFLKTQDQWRQ